MPETTAMTEPTDASVGMRTAGRHTLRVAIRKGSSTTQPPVLLCNGIGARLELLQPFLDRLDPALTVVRFDVPGVGGSPQPHGFYTFPGLAWSLTCLMRDLGHRRFDVLGISWGGALAQQLAFQNPKRVRRLVLAATATGSLMVPAHPKVLGAMVTPRRYTDARYAEKVAAMLYGGALAKDPSRVREVMQPRFTGGSSRGYVLQLLAGAGWTSLPFLPLIRQQTLLLSGLDDRIVVPVNNRIMHRLLPHSTLHEYDDGHLGLVTLADELGPQVSSFLLSDSPRPATFDKEIR